VVEFIVFSFVYLCVHSWSNYFYNGLQTMNDEPAVPPCFLFRYSKFDIQYSILNSPSPSHEPRATGDKLPLHAHRHLHFYPENALLSRKIIPLSGMICRKSLFYVAACLSSARSPLHARRTPHDSRQINHLRGCLSKKTQKSQKIFKSPYSLSHNNLSLFCLPFVARRAK